MTRIVEHRPLVSIVIPTFNRGATLRRAIASALGQTYENVEVVVSDNASTDGSIEAVRDLETDSRLRIIQSDTNLGPVPNWQKALEATTGDYVKVVWSDDWMEPDTVEALIRPMLQDASVGFTVCPQTIHYRTHDSASSDRSSGPITFSHLVDSRFGLGSLPVSPGAALVKRRDAIWGVTCSFGKQYPRCRDGAIGLDLLMLYGALRRGETGYWVSGTRVHFDAGEDSITMTEESNRLRTCYSLALAYLATQVDDYRERIVLKHLFALLAVKQAWSSDADPQQLKSLQHELGTGASASDWTIGTIIAIIKSARYTVRQFTRRVRKRPMRPQ